MFLFRRYRPLKLPLSCEVVKKMVFGSPICRGRVYLRFRTCVFKSQLLLSMPPILVEFRSASSENSSENVRPISLLPGLAKVFERFIHDRLLDFLRPTLDPLQFGSLKGRSTLHALTSVLHSWQSALDKGHSVRALFVDYSKAFDRVNHNILLQNS